MKTIFNKVCGLLLLVIFTGCSEDYDGLADMEKYPQIYMPQARTPVEVALTMNDDIQIIPFGASYGGLTLPTEDIGVSFKIAPEQIVAYNQLYSASYDLLPRDTYTIVSLHTTIKAGNATSVPLAIEVYPGDRLQVGKQYILPVTLLSSTSDVPIREDLKTVYFVFRVNN